MVIRRTEVATANKVHTKYLHRKSSRGAGPPRTRTHRSPHPTGRPPYPQIIANVHTELYARHRGLDFWATRAAHLAIYYTARIAPPSATCVRAEESERRAAHIGAAQGRGGGRRAQNP